MPNVIFIITDQQRASTIGCYGLNDSVKTPALDGLARTGVRFTSCYASQPVCSPSRSSIMTGLYPSATGVVDNCNPHTQFYLPDHHFTWLQEMHENGHEVCNIGKWHLGVSRRPIPKYFDVWHGYETGWGHWIVNEPTFPEPGEIQSGGDQPKVEPGNGYGSYRVDEETDFAIDFIRRNRDNPFVCLLSFYPPHGPKTAPAEDVEFYKSMITPHDQAVYHAMVRRIDRNIGRLLSAVDTAGLREDTIIVFTSDHGENYPQRWNEHGKRLCYDQSSNVPLIISWPGVIPQGEVVDGVVSNVDLCPTILDLCDQSWPEEIHGRSAKDLVIGNRSSWDREVMIQNNPYRIWDGKHREMRERCLVTGEWKLIMNNMRPPELFHRGMPEIPENNLYGGTGTGEPPEDLVERLLYLGEYIGDDLTRTIIHGGPEPGKDDIFRPWA